MFFFSFSLGAIVAGLSYTVYHGGSASTRNGTTSRAGYAYSLATTAVAAVYHWFAGLLGGGSRLGKWVFRGGAASVAKGESAAADHDDDGSEELDSQPDSPELGEAELESFKKDYDVVCGAATAIAAICVVRMLMWLLSRKIVTKETLNIGLNRAFQMIEAVADAGIVATFFFGAAMPEFLQYRHLLGVVKKLCFKNENFSVRVGDALLAKSGLGYTTSLLSKVKRHKWKVAGVTLAVVALGFVTMRAWKKITKGKRFSVSAVAELFGSPEPEARDDSDAEPLAVKDKRKKVKGKRAHNYDGEPGKTHMATPEAVVSLPPWNSAGSGELTLYDEHGLAVAKAGVVVHGKVAKVVTIDHAVRDGAFWDGAGKVPAIIDHRESEDELDAISVLKAPGNTPKAAKAAKLSVASAPAFIWCDGKASQGNVMQGEGHLLNHTCATVPGYSGSLLFAFFENKWQAVGVHCGAQKGTNIAYSFF